jgi:hypothetical protein
MIGVKLMNNKDSLTTFIEDRLYPELSAFDEDLSIRGIASDLAYGLKNNGYCSEPYSTYENALYCPINKRREKECLMASCPNNEFCRLLRREGYIK